MYLGWAGFYEGGSDRSYFDSLIPRVIEDITRVSGTRSITIPATPSCDLGVSGREIAAVAREVCQSKDFIHIIFIHSDTGGRGTEADIALRTCQYCETAAALCDWPLDRCVIVAPRHETEAWLMADPDAVLSSLGYRGTATSVGLPNTAIEAENLRDPKGTLSRAVQAIIGPRGRRGFNQLYTSIAQTQRIDLLRRSPSFQAFEENLRRGLHSLGCI